MTAIGANAFKECFEITEVVIPDSVTNVDKSAFSHEIWFEDRKGEFNVTYKGKTYKNNQLTHFFKAVNGN